MKNRWFYIAVSCTLGITFVSQHYSIVLFSITLVAFTLIILREKLLGVGCVLTFMISGLFYYIYDTHNVTKLNPETNYFIGKAITDPSINGDRFTVHIKLANKEKLRVSYKLKNEEEKNILTSVENRSTCRFYAKLEKPVPARNFYSFDFKQYLFHRKIHWIATPPSANSIQCLQQASNIQDTLFRFREDALNQIDAFLPSPLDGFVQALVFGGRANVDRDVLTAYQELGLIHLLAISGMHIGLISASVFFCLVRFGLTKEKAILLIMVLLPIYTILAGAAPSVVRAGIMTFLVLLKVRFKSIPFTSLDLISLAFLFMVIVNPYYMFDVGFQLSFSVSLALILSSQTILLKVTNPIVQMLLVSTIAQISSTPLILFHFYQFSLISIPLNLIYVPVITFIVLPICIFVYVTLKWDLPLQSSLISFSNDFLLYLNKFAITMTNLNHHILVLGKPNFYMLGLYIAAVIITFILLEKKINWTSFIPIVVVMFFHFFLPYIHYKGEVTMIDVGQGDSILIEIPFRKEVYLIDTGGTVSYGSVEEWRKREDPYSIGKDTILPYLKAKGIRKIDKLILTHPDVDHMGEAEFLVNHIKIDEIVIGAFHTLNDMEKRIISLAKKKKVVVKRVQAGDRWEVIGIPFQILSPFRSYLSENNSSIVITTYLGGKSWLFTGDIEEETEKDFVKKYPNLKVDILKIPHHGSKTSSTSPFLSVVQPKIALISAGNRNRFNHPHPEVLERLQQQETVVYRTDEQGAIQYKFSIFNTGTFRAKLP
ncbi:competence protein ComEC [Bacillus mesophilus]|nr:DNA internalization-related competence protein ComEC/Rec2 [Bacillus mesophilus]MBM7660768.1 competence protein ComEC [Bacillus mesophilus]